MKIFHICTNGSQFGGCTAAGFHQNHCKNQSNFKLNVYNSVFHAEVVGIAEGAKWSTALTGRYKVQIRKKTKLISLESQVTRWMAAARLSLPYCVRSFSAFKCPSKHSTSIVHRGALKVCELLQSSKVPRNHCGVA